MNSDRARHLWSTARAAWTSSVPSAEPCEPPQRWQSHDETLDAEALGLPRGDMADLAGGTPEDNAKILHGVLSGYLNGTRKNAVLLNAAAALAAESGDFREGFALAKQALESGAALGKLEQLVEFSAKA